jgi:hypothetical protein
MATLSDKARSSQQALRDAAAKYQAVVDRIVEDPRGEFFEELRYAGDGVADAATRFALDYAEGAEPA